MENTNRRDPVPDTHDEEFIMIIGRIYNSLVNGMKSSNAGIAKRWLKERKLSADTSGACYNSGQIHHRKDQPFKEELVKTGFLVKSRVQAKEGQISYKVFGKLSVIFPLRNKAGEIVNLYAIRIKDNKTSFLNDEGIYPWYPAEETEELIIAPTVLDAATILQSGILKEKQAVIALFDSELKPQHIEAISNLKQLKIIVWIEYSSK